MKSELIVSLEGVELKGNHGIYDFEKQNGNTFVVDIRVRTSIDPTSIESIHETVNYERLYEIVEEEMKIEADLLEEVATRIGRKILKSSLTVAGVEISLAKQNPPIKGKCKSAKITVRMYR